MKKLFSASAIALALSAGAALAADLPAVKAPLLPPPPPPPLWTGFYVGLNAGYSFGSTNNADVTTTTLYDTFGTTSGTVVSLDPSFIASGLAASGTANVNRSGFIGGGQIGYNYQFRNNFVVGLEADLQGAGIRGEAGFIGGAAWSVVPTVNPLLNPLGVTSISRLAAGSTTVTARTDWLGTVRGRLGYLWNPSLLLYVTGGLAYGGAQATTHQTYGGLTTAAGASLVTPFTPFTITAPYASLGGVRRYDDTRIGWTVGAGLEWLFSPNLSFKVEYLYYDLGTARYLNGPIAAVGPISTVPAGVVTGLASSINQGITRVKFDGHIARVGINYHFVSAPPVPVVARY